MDIVILILLLVASISFNVVLIKQRKILHEELLVYLEEREVLSEAFNGYRSHLEQVYELPLFYGDATMKNLMEHTKEVSSLVAEYEEILEDSEEVEDEAPSS